MSSASVLYDVPGPRSHARNRALGIAVVILVAALLAFVVYRLFTTGQFTAEKWQAFTYPYVWSQIGLATLRTLSAFALAAVGSLVFGFVLAYARLSAVKVFKYPAVAVTEVLRAIPVLVMMMLLYYGFGAIGAGMSSFTAVVLALIAYNGSVLAEVFRAGVESLPRGQSEAGYSIGMRPSQVMNLILMPQAIRAMLPVIISQLVVTLKDTALGFVITYNELLYYAKNTLMSQTSLGNPIIPSVIVVGTIYILLCAILSWFASWVQKRTSRSPKVKAAKTHHPANPGDQTTTQLMAQQDLPAELQAQLDGDSKGNGKP